MPCLRNDPLKCPLDVYGMSYIHGMTYEYPLDEVCYLCNDQYETTVISLRITVSLSAESRSVSRSVLKVISV